MRPRCYNTAHVSTQPLIAGMCTGQICESNQHNELVGAPFKSDQLVAHSPESVHLASSFSRYNGVQGWELRCEDVFDRFDGRGNMINSEDIVARAPNVRSPIDGKYLGRMRVDGGDVVIPKYMGCANDGVVVAGTGRWQRWYRS